MFLKNNSIDLLGSFNEIKDFEEVKHTYIVATNIFEAFGEDAIDFTEFV